MKNRYDFMKEGVVLDEDSSVFPDVLSLSYSKFTAEETFTPVSLDDVGIMQFWKTTYNQYGVAELDDIVLSLNGVPHKNFLKPGDVIYFPAVGDIIASFTNRGR